MRERMNGEFLVLEGTGRAFGKGVLQVIEPED
jgi:hypothetical protein